MAENECPRCGLHYGGGHSCGHVATRQSFKAVDDVSPVPPHPLLGDVNPRPDIVDHVNPRHYRKHPSGVECIEITEHMGFNLGNAVKYIWRCSLKHADPIPDLEKAIWYLQREIARLGKGGKHHDD